MNINKLCIGSGLDEEVTGLVLKYNSMFEYDKISDKCNKLYMPATWDEGIRELQEYCGEDEDGIKMLTLCLYCLIHTYDMYQEKGIPDIIFWDTIKFIPRFMGKHKELYGKNAFTWAWWFPRQISMYEYRIGEYEYEFIEEDSIKKISLHIPSDANLKSGNIAAVFPFVQKYYPEYINADIVCDSWLMVPALTGLLPPGSNIVQFQKQFNIKSVDEDSLAFMDWIYQSRDIAYNDLPENTSLQRKVKEHLLSGGKIGWAYGIYKKQDIS